MGLDVTAYETVAALDPQPPRPWTDDLYEEAIHVFSYGAFEHALNGLPYDYEISPLAGSLILDAGWYQATGETLGMRAGSYGGYNRFREALADAALGVTPDVVWNEPTAYAASPFFELIHFADNEGCLSGVACAHLAADFAEQREVVLPKWDPDDETQSWFREKYDGWQELFKLASGDGLVVFS
jgi:hypothetical protein